MGRHEKGSKPSHVNAGVASRGPAVTFKQKWLVIAAYITLALPVCVFMLGWLSLPIGIAGTAIVVASLVWLCLRDWKSEKKAVRVPVIHFLGAIVLFCIVVFLSGIAQVGVGTGDVPYRNAIFHDLVLYDWPVVYDSGYALTYYVAFWMLPALVGKLLGLSAGYVALFIFAVFIMTLVYLLVACLLNIETAGKLWLVAIFIVCWSGVHYIAAAFMTMMGWSLYDYPILSDGSAYMDRFYNGESFNWYYRSNFLVLTQTYNQMMIWVAVAVMLSKRSPRGYMALGLLVLPYSPWGFIGLIPLLIAAAIPTFVESVRKEGPLSVVKQIFSPANIGVTLVVIIVFGSYFIASTASGGVSVSVITAEQVAEYQAQGLPYSTQTGSFGLLSFDRMGLRTLVCALIFWVFEFGLFALFLFKDHKRDGLFWTIIVVLMVVPFIWAGSVGGRDFCMNASIPGVFVLMVFTLQYLRDRVCGKPMHFVSVFVVLVLAFSLCGTTFSLMDKAGYLWRHKTLSYVDNSVETLEGKNLQDYGNFLADGYQDTLFFKYLAG